MTTTEIIQDAIPIAFSPDRLTLITSDGEYQDGFWDATGSRYCNHLSADGWVRVIYAPNDHVGAAIVEHEDGSKSTFSIEIDYSV